MVAFLRLHVILDGIAMGAVFTLTLCTVSSVDPQSFTKMYPLEIQKIALPIPDDSRRTKIKNWDAVCVNIGCGLDKGDSFLRN